MPPPPAHDYDAASCSQLPRHKHGYRPPRAVNGRCPLGHRQFTISVGGPLPIAVFCTTCGKPNVTATAYEKGLADGRAS
jgi:hypothetical protein